MLDEATPISPSPNTEVESMARRGKSSTKRPIESYEHEGEQRLNNPPVGLVTPDTDPDAGATQTGRSAS